MNPRIILALCFFTFLLSGSVFAADTTAGNPDQSEAKPWVRKVAFGILAHDIGFISDKRENGVDINWETNNFTKNLWFSAGLTTAIHTGPLRKNDKKCREDSDCGFGSRVLPRIALEIGYNFLKNQGISLFFDHMSHGSVGCSCIQNEGIDHTGIRYHFAFNTGTTP
jgi:hypothetical protein